MLRKFTSSMMLSASMLSLAANPHDSTVNPQPIRDTISKPPPVTLSGSVDAYYRFNFSNPKTGTNNYSSFTNSQNSFELGMASIRADHSFGSVGAVADLGFGKRAEEFSYNDGSHQTLFAVKQLFISYQANSHIRLSAGKWATHIGYEVLDAYLNRNYSMDYMFSFGPFFHTGLKADVTLSPTTGFMIGIANPSDFSSTSSSTKVLIAQFSTGTKDGRLKAFLNYQGYTGVRADTLIATGYTLYKSLQQADLVVNASLSSKFGIGLNATTQVIQSSSLNKTAAWWGSAVYLNFDPLPAFGLTFRAEYFSDPTGIKINPIDLETDPTVANGLRMVDLTLSGICKLGSNLVIIPELRMDAGSKNFFLKSDAQPAKATMTGLIAAIYHF